MRTFRVTYKSHNRENQNVVDPEQFDQIETLFDAIEIYCPNSDISIQVGPQLISLDACRDMYGLFDSLLTVMHAVAFDLPCDSVGYPDALTPGHEGQRSYGIMLTEQSSPPLLVFIADHDHIYFQTRHLTADGIVALVDDITIPVVSSKREVIVECTEFMLTYLADLTKHIPKVLDLCDYKECMHKLELMRRHANTG